MKFPKLICESATEKTENFFKQSWIYIRHQRFQIQIVIIFNRSQNKIANFIKSSKRNYKFGQKIAQTKSQISINYQGKNTANFVKKFQKQVVSLINCKKLTNSVHERYCKFCQLDAVTVASFDK